MLHTVSHNTQQHITASHNTLQVTTRHTLQHATTRYRLQQVTTRHNTLQRVTTRHHTLQQVTVHHNTLQRVTTRHHTLQQVTNISTLGRSCIRCFLVSCLLSNSAISCSTWTRVGISGLMRIMPGDWGEVIGEEMGVIHGDVIYFIY